MGFCRRCGDIVTGARCNKCGGFSVGKWVHLWIKQSLTWEVAPVVKWSQGDDDSKQDRWSRTYVTRDKSPTQEPSTNTTSTTAPLRPHSAGANRFPKPANHSQAPQTRLGARVSAHITAATASRPASPLKHSTSASEDSNAEEGILPNLHHSSELAKVYGSVLQPKESLESYHCALCSTVFSPDATIYPDPSTLSSSGESLTGGMGNRFLCRPCFVANGGSKGECPGCYRPVLILKAEGGFVEAAGSVWHRRCFNCDGCLKNIGDHPMVDLLGRPSCADCFETCLKRPPRDGNTPASPTGKSDPKSNLGGMKRNNNQSREGSPALQELELRLGILRSREGTPAREETVGRLNMDSFSPKNYDTQDSPVTRHRSSFSRETSPKVERRSGPVASILDRYRSPEPDSSDTDAGSPRPRRYSYSRLKSDLESSDDSPVRRRLFETESKPSSPRATGSPRHGSPKPTEAAIEEMKRRFLNQASSSPKSTAPLDLSSERTTPVRRRRSKSRSRSRPRFSDPPTESESTHTTPRNTPVRPALKSWSSTSSLRSALKSQNTGETDFSRIQSQRTGESALPLVRSQRTGDTEFTLERDYTGTTSYISSQRTGETVYDAQPVRRQKTGETLYNPQPVRRQKTGESAYTSQPMRRQKTGDTIYEPQPVRRQKTGDTMYEPQPVRRQKTGDTSYDPQPIRRQKTGDRDYVRRQRTGETVYPQSTGQTEYVRRQRTGDRGVRTQNTGETALSLRAQRTGETEIQSHRTGGTDYTLRRDRTGDAEVESLLGDLPVQEPVNLIDVSIPSSESSGSMSRIPVPVRRSDLSGIASLRTSSSTSSLRRSYEPATPDLSDFSDTMSIQSSGPSTPPSVSPPSKKSRSSLTKTSDITPTSKSKRSIGGISIPDPLPANTRCAKCKGPLFNTKHGGKFVTVPVEPTSTGLPPKTYHTACFTCNVCGEVFEEKEGGHAVFVRGEEGACHVRVSVICLLPFIL